MEIKKVMLAVALMFGMVSPSVQAMIPVGFKYVDGAFKVAIEGYKRLACIAGGVFLSAVSAESGLLGVEDAFQTNISGNFSGEEALNDFGVIFGFATSFSTAIFSYFFLKRGFAPKETGNVEKAC